MFTLMLCGQFKRNMDWAVSYIYYNIALSEMQQINRL